MFNHKCICSLLLCFVMLVSCSQGNKSSNYGYLNNNYYLVRCGDIHGAGINEADVLDRYPSYTDYTSLFDKKKSYLNFQCKGTSYDDFWCEGSINIVDKKSEVLLNNDSFSCWTNAFLYYGRIIYLNKDDETKNGAIYVFAPYWCRIQLSYDVGGGNLVLLTFEFWKGEANELPSFIHNTSR